VTISYGSRCVPPPAGADAIDDRSDALEAGIAGKTASIGAPAVSFCEMATGEAMGLQRRIIDFQFFPCVILFCRIERIQHPCIITDKTLHYPARKL